MKLIETVVASTHIDSQGERMSRGALDSMIDAVSSSYISVGIEHDPRIPPQGRIATAFVRERIDGESEVVAVMELFEDTDEPSAPEDVREIVLRDRRTGALTISHDWAHRSDEDQSDINAISDAFGTKAVYEVKKAADPISIITIAGALVLGGIATGFLGQIGADAWAKVKKSLDRLLSRTGNRKGEQLLVLSVLLNVDGTNVEVEAILTNPTPEQTERLFSEGLRVLDEVVPVYLRDSPHVRRLVFDVKSGEFNLKFAVRKDCRPLSPSKSVREILEHKNEP